MLRYTLGKTLKTGVRLGCTSVVRSQARSIARIPPLHPISTGLLRRFYAISTDGKDVSDQIDQINDLEYNKISNEYLETMSEEIEALSEETPDIDIELTQGVLTLTLPPNGTYVINRQPPNKQIWLSSPISGPKRYDLIGGRWVTLRDGSSLTDLLEEEISQALGTEFHFEGLEA